MNSLVPGSNHEGTSLVPSARWVICVKRDSPGGACRFPESVASGLSAWPLRDGCRTGGGVPASKCWGCVRGRETPFQPVPFPTAPASQLPARLPGSFQLVVHVQPPEKTQQQKTGSNIVRPVAPLARRWLGARITPARHRFLVFGCQSACQDSSSWPVLAGDGYGKMS